MMGRLVDNKDPKPYKKDEWLCPNIKKVSSFNNSKSFVVCHLGASNPLKFWPAKYWQTLIEELKHKGFEIYISAGPGEEYLIREVDSDNIYQHIRGTYSLLEMWFLIDHAKLLISVDTGIAHLAKLSNTPIITLFGPGSQVSHGAGNFWKFSHCADITKSDFN
jgi:ADP-heptose:LPS heptosyltransferase